MTIAGTLENAFELRRQSGGAVVELSASIIPGSPTAVLLTFTSGPVEFGSLADGRYNLKVFAGPVSNNYGSLDGEETYVSAMRKLAETCQEVIDGYVVEHVLRPLQQAIAIS